MFRIFRGYRARKAVWNPDRDFWLVVEDEILGDIVYYNVQSMEQAYSEPFELSLFPHRTANAFMLEGGWIELHHALTGKKFYYSMEEEEYRWVEPPQVDPTSAMETARMLSSPWAGLSPYEMYDGRREWFASKDPEYLMREGDVTKELGKWQERREVEEDVVWYVHQDSGEARWSLSPKDVEATM